MVANERNVWALTRLLRAWRLSFAAVMRNTPPKHNRVRIAVMTDNVRNVLTIGNCGSLLPKTKNLVTWCRKKCADQAAV
jgi:hypothetical protein